MNTTISEFDQIACDAKVQIEYQSQQTVWADIDSPRFRQVIRNLLSNATKFSPAGSTVQVELRKDSTGECFEVLVSDQGPGIPEDEVHSIFEKFKQSTRTNTGAGGTGLGLAISREIVAAHHGWIWACNSSSGGACFVVMIPLQFGKQLLHSEAA